MSIFVAVLFGALASLSTGAPVTPKASRSKEPFIDRDVIFSIASLPPTALACLARTSSSAGSATAFASAFGASAFGVSGFPGASAFGLSCAADVTAARIEKAKIKTIRFIKLSLPKLNVSVRRLFEFRLVNLDVVFDLGEFHDPGDRRSDELHQVRDFDAVHRPVIVHVGFGG